jgi:phage-related protein
MAVVIGSASIKITALTEDLKKTIGRDLNDAIGEINTTKLDDLNSKLRQSELDLVRARQSVAKFAKETAAAEKELAAARADSASTPEKIAEAELKLARAQAEGNVARDKVRTITLSMTKAQEDYRKSTVKTEEDSHRLHQTMTELHGITRGLGTVFGLLLPNMNQAHLGAQALGTTLTALTKVTALALAGQAAFAGAGGLVSVAGALSQAAGAALLIPAALGAGVIAVGALTIGLQGMGDALKVVGDTAKFNEAIKDLSPNARSFALAVHDLVPAFKELRLQVQDRLFAGLGQDFAEIGRLHLPVIQKGLTAMAASLNEGAKGFAAFARDKQTVSDLGTLFANSSLGAHFLAQAVQPVLSALRDIGTVGSEFLPGLADGFSEAATRFGEFIAHARESGKLKEVLSDGLSALGDIFSILGNIGSIIGSVLHAGQAAGAGLLGTVKDITGELAQWAKSVQGQAALTSFLTATKQVAMALLPILGSVIELVAHQLAPILATIATTVGPSVKIVLDAIGKALESAKPGIAALAQGFASFLAALAPALPALGRLVNVLGQSLGAVLERLGPVIADVASVLADQLAAALPSLVPAIVIIAEAFGRLVEALAPLIPSVLALLGPFVEAGGIIDALVPIVVVLVDAFGQLADALGPVITLVADVLIQAINALAPVFPVLTDAILQLAPAFISLVEALLPLIDPLVQLLAIILPPLIELFVAILVPVVGAASAILNILVPAITFLLEIVIAVVGGVTNWFANLNTNVTAIFNAIGSFFTDIWNGLKNTAINAAHAIADGVRSALSVIGGFFAGAFEAGRAAVVNAFFMIKDGVANGIEAVLSWIRGMPGRIVDAIGNLGSLLWDIGRRLITGLLDGIKAGAKAVFDFIKSIGPTIANLKGPLDVDKRLLIPAGLAIMSGLHASLVENFAPVEEFMSEAGLRLAKAFTVPDLSVGVSTPQLPGVRLGTSSTPRGGDGASAAPADLHDAVVSAIEGWQVIVSARETANKVNKVNADNRGR